MVESFGVRHHSPAVARLVARQITNRPPAIVLIEGPTEYNQRTEELMLDHELLVMLYSRTPMFLGAPEGSMEWGIRRDSFYPLTDYSPEWAVLHTAHRAGVPVEFIDPPQLAFTDAAVAENRYAETSITRGAADRLIRKFGVDDMADLIDELIETNPELSLKSYRERIGLLGLVLCGEPDRKTKTHEAHVTYRTTNAWQRFGDDMLVVCRATHVNGLEALLSKEVEPADVWVPSVNDNCYGIALTPISHAVFDVPDGYDAGQPSPDFYDRLYRDRTEGWRDTNEELPGQVVLELHRAKQFVSLVDLIVMQATTGALTQLQGHQQIWRTDLVEEIATAFVKDDPGEDHPLLTYVNDALRGDRLGHLVMGARQPPLTPKLWASLKVLGLFPMPKRRKKSADLLNDLDLRRSQPLHSLTVLNIPGVELATNADDDDIER